MTKTQPESTDIEREILEELESLWHRHDDLDKYRVGYNAIYTLLQSAMRKAYQQGFKDGQNTLLVEHEK